MRLFSCCVKLVYFDSSWTPRRKLDVNVTHVAAFYVVSINSQTSKPKIIFYLLRLVYLGFAVEVTSLPSLPPTNHAHPEPKRVVAAVVKAAWNSSTNQMLHRLLPQVLLKELFAFRSHQFPRKSVVQVSTTVVDKCLDGYQLG